jgi:hypothetical protein
MIAVRVLLAVLLVSICGVRAVCAQPLPKGYLSLFTDYFPNQRDTIELRARLFVEETIEPTPRLEINLSGFAEGLLARRPHPAAATPSDSRQFVKDAIVRVHDANLAWTGERADVLVGYARVAWGKLDEIQPTDVINPLDVSRFFFEGRSEARLPVLLVRGRWHFTPDLTIEGIVEPDFRRGRFDRLDEPTSPFNLPLLVAEDPIVCLALGCPVVPTVDDRQPAFTAENMQGGARVSATTGRVDWSVSAYRGFDSFRL